MQTDDPSFGPRPEGFGLPIAGSADIPFVLEASAELSGGTRLPLQVCTLTNGLVYLTDPQWANYPARFYRIRSP